MVRTIAYLVKGIDPNKMELCWASNVHEAERVSSDNSSDLESAISKHTFGNGVLLFV